MSDAKRWHPPGREDFATGVVYYSDPCFACNGRAVSDAGRLCATCAGTGSIDYQTPPTRSPEYL